MELTERDRRILELEREWWTDVSVKRSEITDELGISTSRYYELLNELIESPAAERHDPLVVHRLRRMRDERRQARRFVSSTMEEHG